MTLEPGRYRIRYIPPGIAPPFVGGLYAVSTDIGQPILAEPLGPEHPSQVWEVHRNENNKYIITQPGFNSKLPGIGPVLMGWSLSSPSADHQGGRILFGVGYVELEIEPVGSSDNYFSIRVPDPNVTHAPDQVEFFIAECDHDLVSRPYWSGLGLRRPHPNWEFIPDQRG
ncbi:hypothetical protein Ac2012v2_005441 [Leucoagaricus gongylophorus]